MHEVQDQPLLHLALAEGVFAAVAALIIFFRHSAGAIVFPLPWPAELGFGIPSGGALGAILGAVLLRSPLRQAVVRGTLPLRSVTGAAWSIIILGILAGLGEELLFRAALQPWIGLWWAAILFGLAHSGTARVQDGVSAGKVVYMLATLAAGLLLGLLYASAGLLAAMAAHASFDIGILLVLAPAIARAGGPHE